MAALFLDFRATLDEDFIWFGSALEAEILASNLSLYKLSVGEKKKKCQFRVNFSFNLSENVCFVELNPG